MEKRSRKKISIARFLTFGLIGLVFVLGVRFIPALLEPTISRSNVWEYAAGLSAGSEFGLKVTKLDGSVTPQSLLGGDCEEFSKLNDFDKKFRRLSSITFEPDIEAKRMNTVYVQQEILEFPDASTAENYVGLLGSVSKDKNCFYGDSTRQPIPLSDNFGIGLDGFWLGTTITPKLDLDPDPTSEYVETQVGLGLARRGAIVMVFLGVTAGDLYDEAIEKYVTHTDLESMAGEVLKTFAH